MASCPPVLTSQELGPRSLRLRPLNQCTHLLQCSEQVQSHAHAPEKALDAKARQEGHQLLILECTYAIALSASSTAC